MRAIGLALWFLATPALASVATGVTKWQAGDWRGAVTEWSAPAQRGDADAMFNMGQAYLLGRGVRQDRAAAADMFRRAAAKDHLGATASLGILLWQEGKRTEALQHLRAAADRGELRAAYVLGVATFSGDSVPKNPALGFAYIARARDGGLPVAQQQAARFATMMTADERMRSEAAAQAMLSGKPVSVALAGYQPQAEPKPPVKVAASSRDDEDSAEEAVETVVAKPVAGKAARPAPAATATATVSAKAGKAGEKLAAATGPKADDKAPAGKAKADKAKAADKPETAGKATAASDEADAKGFRVQLGAYNNEQAAKSAWTTLVSQQAGLLKSLKPNYLAKGGLVRLQVGPFGDRDDARALCQKLSAAGRPCFVTS